MKKTPLLVDAKALVDTVLMGRRTYEQILEFGEYPYIGTQGFVFSRTCSDERDKNVKFILSDLTNFIEGLKSGTGKDIWLVGGASIIQSCLRSRSDKQVCHLHPSYHPWRGYSVVSRPFVNERVEIPTLPKF